MSGRNARRFSFLARWLAGLVALGLLGLGALELRLPGPAGMSVYVLYRSARAYVRDLMIPPLPSLEGFSNRGPNVVVIVLDCYRADYLRKASPNLRAFGERAWRFDRYYAAAPWTKPSTVSLFTGLHVRRHYVIRGGGHQLPQQVVTLAELMKAQGYATGGFVWNPHLSRRQAFDQGFDHYVDDARKGSKSLLYEFLSWVDRERPERLFAYVHFKGTHDPYYDDNDLSTLITAPHYQGDFAPHRLDYKEEVKEGRILAPDESVHLQYVAEGVARKVDREAVGAFLERFRASGLDENTLLIFTSDHGDAFFEHGTVSHGHTVYDEEVHVPLVLYLPEAFARNRSIPTRGRHPCPTSTVDLLPTVLDFVGAEPPPDIDGVSLLPRLVGEPDCARPVIAETTDESRSVTGAALVQGGQKLIVDYREDRVELFDLTSDPGERRDLSRHRRERASALQDTLSRRLNADGSSLAPWSQVPGELPAEQEEALRALGYVE